MSDETLALQTSEEPTTASTEQSAPAPQPLRIEDIKPRMAFTGRVIRVELGGAFIDIGGLIGFLHISQIVPPDDKPVLRVADALKENDTLTVYVSRVFPKRKRIDLTMRRPAAYGWDNLQVGMKLHNVKVVSVESFGVFVDFDGPKHALIPFNLMPKGMRPKVDDVIETAWVVEVDEPKRRIGLTMVEPPALPWERIKKGEKYPGKVVRVERNAAYVDIGAEREGVVRASSLGASFLDMRTFVTQGEEVTVKVLRADPGKRILELALEGVNPSDFALSSGPEEELSPFAVALQRAQRLKRAQEAASNAARAEESTS